MHPLLFLFVLCNGLLVNAAPKPKVVSISVSPGDPKISADVLRVRARLKECGYEVAAIDASDPDSLKKQISKLQTDKNAVVFVDGHGILTSETGAPSVEGNLYYALPDDDLWLTGEELGSKVIKANEVFSLLENQLLTPQIWLDS